MNFLTYAAGLPDERAVWRHSHFFPTQRLNDTDEGKHLSNPYSTNTTNNLKPLDHYGTPILSYKTHPNPPDLLYIRDHEKANMELARLFRGRIGQSMQRVVGFDVEWRPGRSAASGRTSAFLLGENPIAVVQIAATRKILVLHLSAMKAFPTKLFDFLKDGSVLKAGVNILGDAQRMHRDFGVTMRSCVELSYLARTLDPHRWPGNPIEFIGLSRLVSEYMNRSLPKNGTRRSNWEEDVLTEEQIDYAANDAHASQVICTILFKRSHHLDRSLFMFDVIRGNAVHTNGRPWQFHQSQSQHLRNPRPRPSGAEEEHMTTDRPTLNNISRGLKVRHLRSCAPTSTFRRPRFESHRRVYTSRNGTKESEAMNILNRLKQLHLCPEGAVIKEGTRSNGIGIGIGIDTAAKDTHGINLDMRSTQRKDQAYNFLEDVIVADPHRPIRFGMRR